MAIHTYSVLDRRFYTKALQEGVSISLQGCKDVENVKGAGKLLELVYDLQLFKASFASSVVGLASSSRLVPLSNRATSGEDYISQDLWSMD